jgi:hypothetical protein
MTKATFFDSNVIDENALNADTVSSVYVLPSVMAGAASGALANNQAPNNARRAV